jgi:hypothetical protein
MASTYSPSLRLELMANSDQSGTWGTTTNVNLGTLVEAAIAGYTSVAVTSASQALTANNGTSDQARNKVINLTGTAGAASVFMPPATKTCIVVNNTNGVVTVYNSTALGNTTAAGTGVAIPTGATCKVFSDGTNVKPASSYLPALTLGTVLPVASGGTGVATLTGIHYGNGAAATTAATAAQIVAAIGATAVTNATNATTAAACSGNAATATNATNATNATTAATCTGKAAGFPEGGLAEIGRYLDMHGTNTATDFDVRLDSSPGTGTIGGGTLSITANGGVVCSANVTAYSDERIKTNWQALPVDFVDRLANVKSGIYDRTDIEATQVGVGAQSLQKLMPEAVQAGGDGMLSVAYGNAALAACVELAKKVVELEARLAALGA